MESSSALREKSARAGSVSLPQAGGRQRTRRRPGNHRDRQSRRRVDAQPGYRRALQKIEWAHTVAYIPREAISGAAIVSPGLRRNHHGPQRGNWRCRRHLPGRAFLLPFCAREADQFSRSTLACLGRSQGPPAGVGRGHIRQGSQGLSRSQSEDRPGNVYFRTRTQSKSGPVEKPGSGRRLRQRPIPGFDGQGSGRGRAGQCAGRQPRGTGRALRAETSCTSWSPQASISPSSISIGG